MDLQWVYLGIAFALGIWSRGTIRLPLPNLTPQPQPTPTPAPGPSPSPVLPDLSRFPLLQAVLPLLLERLAKREQQQALREFAAVAPELMETVGDGKK